MTIKKQIQKILEGKTPQVFGSVLRPYTQLKEQIIIETAFLSDSAPLKQRIYHILNDITTPTLCNNCKEKHANFLSFNEGYAKYCSRKCANSHSAKKEITQKTWKEKYGSREKRAEIQRARTKKIMIEKTGYESNFHNPDWQKNNNGGNFAWNKEAREKRKQTCQSLYGTNYACQSSSTIEKKNITFKQKYEHGHPMRDSKILKKREQIFLENYGFRNPHMHPDVIEKGKQTCIKRYGVPNPAQGHIKNIELWYDKEFIITKFLNKDGTIRYREVMDFFGCSFDYIRSKFTELNIPWKPYKGYSRFEVEIREYIRQLIPTIQISDKPNTKIIAPYHIDVWVPEFKLGIEFHGLCWHSFGNNPNNAYLEKKDKNRHKIKADKAHENNIALLQIFENEWENPIQCKIWKSMINSRLDLNKKIFGRKCTIKSISIIESNKFLIENHMQGSVVGSSLHLGLFYKDNLMALMVFGKPRFKVNADWELLRFCNKINHTVLGGFSKLLKYFCRKNKGVRILSYANRRWSQGNIYEKNKFQFQGIIEPGYYYFQLRNITRIYHRIAFQKHKLENKLDIFNKSLTETENMYANDYRKIYDAGQIKYMLNTALI